jgi:hypothetical protein
MTIEGAFSIFLIHATKNVPFPKNSCANIECPDVDANILLVFFNLKFIIHFS